MTSQLNLYKFNEIYDKTHLDLLKYVIIKCHNINDTQDIMQETYLELWNILNRKELSDINIKSYLIGIANNKIKKHYTLLQRLKTVSLFDTNDKDIELIDTIKDKVNINDILIKEENWNTIWKYIKNKKQYINCINIFIIICPAQILVAVTFLFIIHKPHAIGVNIVNIIIVNCLTINFIFNLTNR